MDQGLAAVLGAGVGVLGTLGTALLAYGAARRQAVDQGKVDHAKELRAERRETYLAFIEAAEPLDLVLHTIAHKDDPPAPEVIQPPDEPVLRRLIDDLDSGVHALYKVQARVDLVGPSAVAGEAVNVWGAARDLRHFLQAVLRGEVSQFDYDAGLETAIDDVERTRDDFARAARDVIASLDGLIR
ncbi:hypothetical protein [Streptomyces sp. IBSBF 3136]|uniref:hypothetical protein n=1 Tax=Streptomyces sp. IBSBF 3136 TaxID=2903524 RepID=UPI002FDC149D